MLRPNPPRRPSGGWDLFDFHNNRSIIAPSFPRRRESNFLRANLDSRLRGNDDKLLLQ